MTKPPQVLVEPEVAALADLYIELVKKLQAIAKDREGLDASVNALVAVKGFLEADEAVRVSGITRPLGALAAAIVDLREGKAPVLFTKERRTSGGRPLHPSFDAVKGAAAAFMSFLIEAAAEKPKAAAAFVADTLSKVGIRSLGPHTVVNASTVTGWRDEMGGKNSKRAKAVYDRILADFMGQVKNRITSAAARRMVKGAIVGLHAEGVTPG